MTLVLIVFIGLIFGSFINVVIYRVPLGKSVVSPPSHCTTCGKTIKWYMNIPIISYIVLRGRCAYCKASVSWQYPVVELITGSLFLGAYLRYGVTLFGVTALLFVLTLFVISIIDLKHFIIPWEILVPAFAWNVFYIVNTHSWSNKTLSFIFAGLLIFVILIVGKKIYKKDVMGGGDVYYAAFIGMFLSLRLLPLFFLASFMIGAIAGIVFSSYAKKKMRELIIPFGPFLSLGGIIAIFWGEAIVDWYLITFLGEL